MITDVAEIQCWNGHVGRPSSSEFIISFLVIKRASIGWGSKKTWRSTILRSLSTSTTAEPTSSINSPVGKLLRYGPVQWAQCRQVNDTFGGPSTIFNLKFILFDCTMLGRQATLYLTGGLEVPKRIHLERCFWTVNERIRWFLSTHQTVEKSPASYCSFRRQYYPPNPYVSRHWYWIGIVQGWLSSSPFSIIPQVGL